MHNWAILICLITGINSQVSTLSVEFRREYTGHGREEVTIGSIYLKTEGTVIIRVTSPVNQWMVIDKNKMLIYYPDEKQAFQIKSENPFSLPFLQSFLSVVKKDYGLSELGYTLENYSKRGDTLFSYWSPPQKAERILGNIRIGVVDGKLALTEIKKPDNTLTSRSLYKNHITYKSFHFPLEIETVHYIDRDSVIERVIYNNPEFNTPIPDSIVNFKIPEGIELIEMELP